VVYGNVAPRTLDVAATGAHGTAEGSTAATSGGDITGPEERLAFALSDGRVGVLAVKGRKVCASLRSSPPIAAALQSRDGAVLQQELHDSVQSCLSSNVAPLHVTMMCLSFGIHRMPPSGYRTLPIFQVR